MNIWVQQPDKVDKNVAAESLPFRTIDVRVTKGGLDDDGGRDEDICLAVVGVIVWLDTAGHGFKIKG